MVSVTVIRHVPEPIIGMIGTRHDRPFEAFEEVLDWLETTGIPVERFDPASAGSDIAMRPVVRQLLETRGGRRLPLILVGDVVVSEGVYPSRAQLARAVGHGQHKVRRAVA